ncbi:MAG: chemotaxis protein CheW [Nitrospirota bacterium]
MNATATVSMQQYLTFLLGDETFSLDIAKVREVLDYTLITPVPRMPEYLQGVINLRGNVVPVVDLRLLFGMPPTSVSVNTCIIITEVLVNNEPVELGLLADAVQEVLDLDPEVIKPAPRIGTKLDNRFIKGMGRQGERFLIILDIDRVFSADEQELAHAMEFEAS